MVRPLRMLLQPMLALLLVASTASAAPTAACKRLTDADSPFLSALSVIMGAHSSIGGSITAPHGAPALDPRVFAAIDEAQPALSQCVAETNPLDLVASLMASPEARTCWQQVWQLDSKSPWGSSSNNDDASGSGDDGNDHGGDDQARGSTTFRDDVCPAVTTLAPCLTDVLVPALERAMANSNGCCDPLNAQIAATFGGATLRATVSSMVAVLGNAFCSTRTHGDGGVETCGDALVNNWMPADGRAGREDHASNSQGDDDRGDEAAVWAVLNAFQIPNDQVCQAAAGAPFTTTVNTTVQYGAPGVTPYGACYAPMDELLQYVRDLPLWKRGGEPTVAVVDQVFGNERCLPGKQLVAWAGDERGVVMQGVRFVGDVLNMFTALVNGGGSSNRGESSSDNASTGEGDDVYDGASASSDDEYHSDEQEPAVVEDVLDSDHASVGGMLVDVTRSVLEQLDYFAGDMCVHLPNGVTCDFPEDSLEQPFGAPANDY